MKIDISLSNEFSSTKSFEIESNRHLSKKEIDWASQAFIRDQTRAMSSNNSQKRVNITVCKNAKRW